MHAWMHLRVYMRARMHVCTHVCTNAYTLRICVLLQVIKCCNISVLDMAFCFFLSGSAVGEIFQDQERRATLQRLHNCSTVPDHYLMQGVNSSALTQLEHLDLSGSPIADAAVQFVRRDKHVDPCTR
eukprot:scpid108069/ scgid1566/ 